MPKPSVQEIAASREAGRRREQDYVGQLAGWKARGLMRRVDAKKK